MGVPKRSIRKRISRDKDTNTEEMLKLFDSCISAVMFEMGMDTKSILKVEDMLYEYMDNERNKIKVFQSKYKNLKEIKKAMGREVIRLRDFLEETIKKGGSKKEVIIQASYKFPNLSKSMIANAYRNIKDDFKIIEESNKAIEECIENEEELPIKENRIERSEIMTRENNLKIKSLVIQGKNGIYKACPECVELQGKNLMSFKDIEEVEKYKKEEIERIQQFTGEIKQVFSFIK